MNTTHAVARRLAHRRGANFSLGFRLLPPAKRRAVYAAYAVCRVADDIVDEAVSAATADTAARLDAWAAEIEATFQGRPSHPVTVALAEALQDFAMPEGAFLGLVEGCRLDLERNRYRTFAELERYCELVAVTISEISLAIFGSRTPRARIYGRNLALALQLTNICRDVGEDAARGRIYLPLDELEAYGVTERDVLSGDLDSTSFADVMAGQCARARRLFAEANPLPGCLEWDARPAVRVMGGVSTSVLDRVAADPLRAYRERVELPCWQRWGAVLAGLLGAPFVGR